MSTDMSGAAIAASVTLLIMATITSTAHGAFKTWTPLPGNPLFEQPGNWSPSGVPNDDDDLIFLDLGVPIADVQFFGDQTVDGVDVRSGFYDFDLTVGFGDTFSVTGPAFPSFDIGWNGDFATARFISGSLVTNQVRVTAGTFWVMDGVNMDIGDALLATNDGIPDLIIEGTVTYERFLLGVGTSPDSFLDLTGSLTIENVIFSTVATEFGSGGPAACEISEGGMLSMASTLECGPSPVDIMVMTGSSMTAEELDFDSSAGSIHLDPLATITTDDVAMQNGSAEIEGKWTVNGPLVIGSDADGATGTASVELIGIGGWLDIDSTTRVHPGSTLTLGTGSLLETSFLTVDGTLVWQPISTLRLGNQQVDVENGGLFSHTLGVYEGRTIDAKSFRARNGGLIDIWNGTLEASDFLSLGDGGFGRLLVDGSNPVGDSTAVVSGATYVGGSVFGASGSGVIDLESGGTFESGGTMWIYDDGEVNVTTGGVGFVAALIVQGGTLDVSNSSFAVGNDDLAMGEPGFVADGSTSADVLVQAGAQVNTSSVGIGILPAGRGFVSMSGAGTTWMNDGGAEGRLAVSGASIFTSTGEISVLLNGSISFLNNAQMTAPSVVNRGRVEGAGRLTGSLINFDVLAPETLMLKDGGDLTLTEFGTLEIDLAGPSSNQFGSVQTENGDIVLAGTLQVTRSGSFVPFAGQTFEIGTITGVSGAVIGEFDDVDGGDDEYAVTYLADAILLEVVSIACAADQNGDGAIGFVDLSTLLGAWGEC
jgi:hypothetical protein